MSVSDTVKVYLKHKPYMLEAIGNGIVNFSALARTVQRDLGIRNHHAVKIAVIRYAAQMRKSRGYIEGNALPVLRDNRITLLDGMRVVIAEKKLGIDNVAEVKLGMNYVYLTDKNSFRAAALGGKAGVVRVHESCSVILIDSPQRLEGVPGVMAFLTSVLAEQGINLIELISCYTQTILVIDKKDALRSYELLTEITRG